MKVWGPSQFGLIALTRPYQADALVRPLGSTTCYFLFDFRFVVGVGSNIPRARPKPGRPEIGVDTLFERYCNPAWWVIVGRNLV